MKDKKLYQLVVDAISSKDVYYFEEKRFNKIYAKHADTLSKLLQYMRRKSKPELTILIKNVRYFVTRKNNQIVIKEYEEITKK